MDLLFLNSWWLPQMAAMATLIIIIVVPIYFLAKVMQARAEKKQMPDNVMFALIKEGQHTIAYVHDDANISAPDIATAITTAITSQQLEHKSVPPSATLYEEGA